MEKEFQIQSEEEAVILTEKRLCLAGNAVCYSPEYPALGLEDVCLEMSSHGKGDIRDPFIEVTHADGSYTFTSLTRMKKFYLLKQKVATLSQQLTYGHYVELLPLKDTQAIDYYIMITEEQTLSIRELRRRIKDNEYERLDETTKLKLQTKEETKVTDFIKNPIVIKNTLNKIEFTEKVLKKLILEQLDEFLQELGNNFCYKGNEYKIKLGDRYNYIDLLLYNIEYNCYVVIELKVTELKKEHIGQIETYMNYIDKNLKTITQDKTIGIIICKKDNMFVMEYCSDSRIYRTI